MTNLVIAESQQSKGKLVFVEGRGEFPGHCLLMHGRRKFMLLSAIF